MEGEGRLELGPSVPTQLLPHWSSFLEGFEVKGDWLCQEYKLSPEHRWALGETLGLPFSPSTFTTTGGYPSLSQVHGAEQEGAHARRKEREAGRQRSREAEISRTEKDTAETERDGDIETNKAKENYREKTREEIGNDPKNNATFVSFLCVKPSLSMALSALPRKEVPRYHRIMGPVVQHIHCSTWMMKMWMIWIRLAFLTD